MILSLRLPVFYIPSWKEGVPANTCKAMPHSLVHSVLVCRNALPPNTVGACHFMGLKMGQLQRGKHSGETEELIFFSIGQDAVHKPNTTP